eukprot:scaffold12954_cov105-Isochrysis_galbana.AAC.2
MAGVVAVALTSSEAAVQHRDNSTWRGSIVWSRAAADPSKRMTASATEDEGGASMHEGRARLPKLMVRDRAVHRSAAETDAAALAASPSLISTIACATSRIETMPTASPPRKMGM